MAHGKIKRYNIVKVHRRNEFIQLLSSGIDKLILQDLLSKYTSSFTERIVVSM